MLLMFLGLCCTCCSVGCNNTTEPAAASNAVSPVINEDLPVFSASWSEYPSWSVFGVAVELGLINGEEGGISELEKKHGVDVVLHQVDYDTCIQRYGAAVDDASCLTNIDVLPITMSRPTTAILATSTSNGADAWLSVEGETLDDLKGKTVYGLDKSVSKYAFVAGLEALGKNPADYTFLNLSPEEATQNLIVGSDNVKSIFVWNPFKLTVLTTKKDANVVLDSSKIRNQIVDMVVMSNKSLERPGGENFAKCICDVFYQVCDRLNDPATRDETLVALGSKFSDLNAEQMAICTKETEFFDSPQKGEEIFNSPEFEQSTMPRVVKFCLDEEICDEAPSISFPNSPNEKANLTFTTKYMKK